MAKQKAIEIKEKDHSRNWPEPSYWVLLNGEIYGDIYYNMRGYVGYLPTPDGIPLDIGEKSLARFKREIATLNKEFAALGGNK